jgi:hypothetical protein
MTFESVNGSQFAAGRRDAFPSASKQQEVATRVLILERSLIRVGRAEPSLSQILYGALGTQSFGRHIVHLNPVKPISNPAPRLYKAAPTDPI